MQEQARPDRREDLLRAAARRFVAAGIRRTTMEDIAREARAGKATLYRYFPNKDAVIDALLAREADRFVQQLDRAAGDQADAPARIEAAFLAGVGFFRDHPLLARGRDDTPGLLLPRIVANRGPLVVAGLERFSRLIAEGIETGELRHVDPRAAAEVLIRLILSYLAFPPMHVRVDDPAQARALARLLVAGAIPQHLPGATAP
jgi:AcrR family transcriptional regulator